MKTRLIFVRHAEAEGNLIREFHGWTDSSITTRGMAQGELLKKRFAHIPVDVLYSSSLKRTLQTAAFISDACGKAAIPLDGLKEINGGEWEGKRWDELSGIWPIEHDTWENSPHLHKMPKGESMVEFRERLMETVKDIISKNIGKNICIVTHGTAIRSMMTWFYGFPLDAMSDIMWYDNTSITMVDFENNTFDVIMEGDAKHLGSELSTIQNQDWWADYRNKMNEKKKLYYSTKKEV